jgi:hypothetical protein
MTAVSLRHLLDRTMNLGVIAFESFLLLCFAGGLLSVAAAFLVGWLSSRRKFAMLSFVLLFPLSIWASNSLFHQRLFAWWHQAQNDVVPMAFPCLEYEPTVTTLRAKYKMTEPEFDHWVASHSWSLRPVTLEAWEPAKERAWLGGDFEGKALATDIAPNGKQLRVFHSRDTTFVLYYAM